MRCKNCGIGEDSVPFLNCTGMCVLCSEVLLSAMEKIISPDHYSPTLTMDVMLQVRIGMVRVEAL